MQFYRRLTWQVNCVMGAVNGGSKSFSTPFSTFPYVLTPEWWSRLSTFARNASVSIYSPKNISWRWQPLLPPLPSTLSSSSSLNNCLSLTRWCIFHAIFNSLPLTRIILLELELQASQWIGFPQNPVTIVILMGRAKWGFSRWGVMLDSKYKHLGFQLASDDCSSSVYADVILFRWFYKRTPATHFWPIYEGVLLLPLKIWI